MINQLEGTYNICSSIPICIKDVVNYIGNVTNNLNNINFGIIPERKGYPKTIWGDNYKLKSVSEWSHQVLLFDGLDKTIEFYKNKI